MSWAEDNGIDTYNPEYDNPKLNKSFCCKSNPRTWLTKEGVVLPIPQMSDSHLSNAINSMLKQNRQPYYLLEEYYLRSKKNLQAKGKRMKTEQEDNILNYFFKKSLCGMVLYVRVTSKDDQRNSTVIKCNEEQALDFLLSVKNKL